MNSTRHAKETVLRAFAMMNGEVAPGPAAAGVIHPGFVNHARVAGDSTTEAPAEWSGPAGFVRTVEALRAAFAGLHFSIEAVVAEDDQVVVDTVMSGRHVGPIDGLPATGARIANRQIHWFRLRDGLIADHSEVRDPLQLASRLAGGAPAT